MIDSKTQSQPGPLKQRIAARLEQVLPELIQLSEYLHANPEIAWQERRAAKVVADLLAAHGFSVTQRYLGLETALRAVLNPAAPPTKRFTVGFLAEYDALPGLGHACGHNLIAATSVGAALALGAVAQELDVCVEVIGTPAEEGGGGKIELLNRGAFTNLHFAALVHPAPADVAEAEPYAVSHWEVSYQGSGAHAAAYPERGKNAADAFVIAQVALGLLRQQLPSSVKIHGIQTVGGEAPNAIPARTVGRWYVRAANLRELREVEPRVRNCFQAGALATDTTLTITPESESYAEMRADTRALAYYRANASALGRSFTVHSAAMTMNRASTDMGNVSQVVNAIHPYIGIDTAASNHQTEFAAACVGEEANRVIADGATALAWTALDLATDYEGAQDNAQ